jgi:hypothetical protein
MMQNKMFWVWIVLTLGLFAVEGDYAVDMRKKEHYFVSEEVNINIDLKTTAFSITDAKIKFENTKDYIVTAPKSASFLETVEINGTSWQIVHYEYKLYPLHAGEITIAPIDISFRSSMGYGQQENNFTFESNAMPLDVNAPKGIAENDLVLSTPHYTLQSITTPKLIEGNTTRLKVGDAIELQIIQEAKNVPDILLRPIRFSDNEQFKIYSEEPILKSRETDTDTIAVRTDSFTFVAVKEGNISIPSQTFIWWDPIGELLHTEKTSTMDFIILPHSPSADAKVTASEGRQDIPWRSILLVSFMLIVLYKISPHLKRWREKQTLAFMQSEDGRFKSLLDACQKGNTNEIYHSFYVWLMTFSPKLSRSGFRGIEALQPSFAPSLHELEAVLSLKQKTFDTTHFIKELKKLRKTLMQEQKTSKQNLPKNINPL